MHRPFELCSIDIAVGKLSLREIEIGMTYGGLYNLPWLTLATDVLWHDL
ncbi:hypothetical protein ACWIGI_06650 [Nocardia sp. NPDC055321]